MQNGNGKNKAFRCLPKRRWIICSEFDHSTTAAQSRQRQKFSYRQSPSFYHGYLSGQFDLEYLCSTFGKKVDASVQQSQSRTATLIFKTAIELNMLTRLLAEDIHISNADYEKLRNRAVAAVKKTNGRIEMIDTINEELFNA